MQSPEGLEDTPLCQLGFSSKIEVPQLGSARAGKFQLELITSSYNTNTTRVPFEGGLPGRQLM
jgi:hypothetical protein